MGVVVLSKSLATERLPNGMRKLMREFVIDIDGSVIRVPIGFVTDYSSFPWYTRWIVRWSKVDVAGVVHDYLYQRGGITRAEADKLWYKVAVAGKSSANKVQGLVSWAGLKLGGWWRWNKYRNND